MSKTQDFRTLYLKRLDYCKKHRHLPDLHSFVVTQSNVGPIQVEYDNDNEFWAQAQFQTCVQGKAETIVDYLESVNAGVEIEM